MTVERCDDGRWLLSAEAYGVYKACMYRPTLEAYRAGMERLLRDGSVRVFTAREKDERAGMLVLHLIDEASAKIAGIAVKEDCRKRGIAGNLLKEAVQQMRLSRVCAETDGDAVGFYRKAGFDVQSKLMHYANGDVTRYDCVWESAGGEKESAVLIDEARSARP